MKLIFFSFILLFSSFTNKFVFGTIRLNPIKVFDRLLIYKYFEEAQNHLKNDHQMAEKVCSEQVVSRLIDIRNSETATGEKEKQIINEIFETLWSHANSRIRTRAFNSAVFHQDCPLIQRFLEMGWAAFSTDSKGYTPLMTSIIFHRYKTFEMLLESGADIHFLNADGENIVHIWARHSKLDLWISRSIVELIEKFDLQYNLPNLNQMTPLEIAESEDNRYVISILKEKMIIPVI